MSKSKADDEVSEDYKKHDNDLYWTMVVHDMKGPVQAELSALKFLLTTDDNNLNTGQREILNDLFSSVKYLQTLVANILHKSKCDNGIIKIKKTLQSLKKLVFECCDEVKYTALERNIAIKISYITDIENLMFDYDEIKRVIHNLLTNAIKYSYKNTNIYVIIKKDGHNLSFSIRNSGAGIDIKNPDDVFKKFTSYSEKYKSINTGLGLYISKQIIEAHNGTININCIPNKYTTVIFTLPSGA